MVDLLLTLPLTKAYTSVAIVVLVPILQPNHAAFVINIYAIAEYLTLQSTIMTSLSQSTIKNLVPT